MHRLFDVQNVRSIYVSAKSADQMDQAQFDIETAMRAAHNLSPGASDNFQINSQAQILNTAQGVSAVMTALLAGTAAISLVVGGIGIMNIMLVAMTERRKEIGMGRTLHLHDFQRSLGT